MYKPRVGHETPIEIQVPQSSESFQMGKEYAQEWAELRGATPLFGYPNLEEAEKELRVWLGVE